MSHFFLHVIVPKPAPVALITDEKYLEDLVDPLLAPYNEQLDVPEYTRPCYCVGRVAKKEARDKNIETRGPIDALRVTFSVKYPELSAVDPYSGKCTEEQVEEAQSRWVTEFIDPWYAAEASLLAAHPEKTTPTAGCDTCQGTGVATTTSNPKSKWDWYAIGGRWTGALGDYEPEKDPTNYEICFLCNGTGKRVDELGLETRVKNPDFGCNGCNNTGRQMKSPSAWPNKGNVVDVGEHLAKLKNDMKLTPFSFVTPDGDWHEKGEMLMWGMTQAEMKKDAWHKIVVAAYEKYKDGHIIVGVDCHT